MNKDDAKDVALGVAKDEYFGGASPMSATSAAIDTFYDVLDPLVPTPEPDPSPKDVHIFDNIVYGAGTPNLRALGMTPLDIIYAGRFWPDGVPNIREQNFDLPDRGIVQTVASQMTTPWVVLDIEHWWPLDHRGRVGLSDRAVANFVTVLEWFKATLSQPIKLGLYSVVRRNYWDAIKSEDDAGRIAWQRGNDKAKPIADIVDAMFPSIYTFYDRIPEYETYAKAQIDEAHRISGGKDVYPYLWPEYHPGGSDTLAGQPIQQGYWKRQLDLAVGYGDGCVIWTRSSATRNQPFPINSGWWKATAAKLREIDDG